MSTRAPSKSSKQKSEAGLSLIEVLISMVVMGIGLLGAVQMIPIALAGVTQAGVRTDAVQVAQQTLDHLMAQDYASATLAAGTYSETFDGHTATWTIADDDPVPGSKRIDLSVSWSTLTGAQEASFTTYLSRGR